MAKVLFVIYVPTTECDRKLQDLDEAEEVISNNDEETNEWEWEQDTETVENDIKDDADDKTTPSLSDEDIESKKEHEKESIDNDNDSSVDTLSKDPIKAETPVEENSDLQETDEVELRMKPAYVRFLSECLSLVEKVKRVLEDQNIRAVQWSQTESGIHIGIFVSNYGSQCEDILRKLSMLQIGVLKDSSVSVFPASISSEEQGLEEDEEQEKRRADELSEKVSHFKNSIKSRLVVDQVVNAVRNDAVFTFDFLMLVILASFVALMGLLESSSVVLVASMLISPLMGPILAVVFGVVIRKMDLIRVGIVNELRGLALCVVIGFVVGFIPACLEAGSVHWRSLNEWPTPEMSSRGALRALPVGILIAVPSGAGVALSILGGKVGSLVGVAISASLLPPAVNAGLLWANAIVAALGPSLEKDLYIASSNNTNGSLISVPSCVTLVSNDYERQYYCSMVLESFILGLISLLLTILNILCIIVMGIIVLKIKEIAPIPHSFIPKSENEFFCQDLRIARESNITMKGQAAAAKRKEWLGAYQNLKSQIGNELDEDEDDERELDDMINEIEDSPSVMTIYDKMNIHPPRWSQRLTVSSSDDSEMLKFTTPASSPIEDEETGMELRQRSPGTSSVKTKEEEDHEKAAYFTVHNYIPPKELLKGDVYSWKAGKFIKRLKLPKTSRFMISRVVEDPQDEASGSTAAVKASMTTINEAESQQPLLSSQNSDVRV